MSKDKRLTYIANAIHAANKINNSYQTWEKTRSDNIEVIPQVEIIKEALQIITDYCPECHKEKLGTRVSHTNIYIDTFTKLKNYVATSNSRSDKRESFIEFINILHPVVNTKNQYIIDKIIKLYNVLHS